MVRRVIVKTLEEEARVFGSLHADACITEFENSLEGIAEEARRESGGRPIPYRFVSASVAYCSLLALLVLSGYCGIDRSRSDISGAGPSRGLLGRLPTGDRLARSGTRTLQPEGRGRHGRDVAAGSRWSTGGTDRLSGWIKQGEGEAAIVAAAPVARRSS